MAVLGDIRVDGVSGLDDDLRVGSVLGSALIDLSAIEIPDRGVDVKVAAVLSDATLVVPDGVTVVDSSSVVGGSTDQKLVPASPAGGEIRVSGFVALGDLKVYSVSTRPPSLGERIRGAFTKKKRS